MADDEAVAEAAKQRLDMFPYHAKSKEECFAQLGINNNSKDGEDNNNNFQRTGLTSEEAAARLATYGPNQLTEKTKVTIWQRIWNQVGNIMVGILVVVAIVSAVQAFRYSLKGDTQEVVTDCIQVGLIVLVITYVLLLLLLRVCV